MLLIMLILFRTVRHFCPLPLNMNIIMAGENKNIHKNKRLVGIMTG